MSSKPTETTNSTAPADKPTEEKKEPLPQLGALEEDDEFEEFETQDWDDGETDLSYLKTDPSSNPAADQRVADSLWEENWDDDDVDDDFSKLLRAEIEKTASQGEDTTMSH